MSNPVNVFEDLDREPGQPRMSDLWEWARDDYRAGDPADVVCERHRLSRSQFFERARREGWLRRDQPRALTEAAYDKETEDAFVEGALDQPPPSAYALYRRAWARAERAILMNRRVEAQGWVRLARDLRKLAFEEAGTLSWKNLLKANEPDCPDSVCSTPAHPRASGEPGLASATAGAAKDGPGVPSPTGSEPSLDARRREGGREANGAPADSADSAPDQGWSRLAFGKPNRRRRRRSEAGAPA